MHRNYSTFPASKRSKASLLVLLATNLHLISATFYFPPEIADGVDVILTSGWNYPNHTEDIDIIWRFPHSIHLEINELQLDGQTGDFLLISDLPLTFEEYFVEYDNTSAPPAFLPDSIVTSHGILLSWELEPGAKFQVLSRHGTFLYFHAEAPSPGTRGTFPYKGFNITVKDLDEMRIPPPTTTTEGTKAPPAPEVEIYTSKYLKNPPFEVRDRKEELKLALATIATAFCLTHEWCGDILTSNFSSEDVNIPTDGGLRMCDSGWQTYESCVQITFAITREEEVVGNDQLVYLLPKYRLDEMWEWSQGRFRPSLDDWGFIPYDNHPVAGATLDAWMWMAGFLGIILLLMIPMCAFWILHEVESKNVFGAITSEDIDEKYDDKGEGSAAATPWRDLSSPIRPILAILKRQSEDTKYLEVSNSDNSQSNEPSLYDKTRAKTKTNVLFQEQEVSFEYDNHGYLPEGQGQGQGHGEFGNEDDGDDVILFGRRHNEPDFMDIAEEDFPPQNHVLRIDRGGREQDHSDTEI